MPLSQLSGEPDYVRPDPEDRPSPIHYVERIPEWWNAPATADEIAEDDDEA